MSRTMRRLLCLLVTVAMLVTTGVHARAGSVVSVDVEVVQVSLQHDGAHHHEHHFAHEHTATDCDLCAQCYGGMAVTVWDNHLSPPATAPIALVDGELPLLTDSLLRPPRFLV